MGIRRLPATALLVLLLAVAVAGETAQEEAVAAVHAGLREIAAKARAQREQAAALKATLSELEALVVNITQEYNETLKKLIGDMSQTIAALQNEHANLAVNSLLQKASKQSLQAKERANPHMETAMEELLLLQDLEKFLKWIHDIKETWATATNTEPYVQMVSAKSAEVYQASRDAISPHVLKAHEFADPYFQEAKKFSKPYIDQVAKASKPHVEKLKTTLKPYTAKAGDAYEKFLETANYIISR